MDSSIIITDSPRAYPLRNDLRKELQAIASRNAVRVTDGNGRVLNDGQRVINGDFLYIRVLKAAAIAGGFNKLAMPQLRQGSDGYLCGIPREFFFELVDHEQRFGRTSRITEADRVFSGVPMLTDNGWPFCSECLLPFTTMANGHPRTGVWVEPIADGEYICGCCWLASNYHGDAGAMINHVLAGQTRGARSKAAYLLEHVHPKWWVGFGYQDVTPLLWAAPGLWELLRLHRVSLAATAAGILRYACEIIRAVKADEASIDRFASRDGRGTCA